MAAGTLVPSRSPAQSSSGTEHPAAPGPATLGTFWHNGAVQEVGQREDGMKRRSQGSRDWPGEPWGDMGIPACANPQLSVALAGAKATELRAVFQSSETPSARVERDKDWLGTVAPGAQPSPWAGASATVPALGPLGCVAPVGMLHVPPRQPRLQHPQTPRKARPALGAVCFYCDLPLQLEFIWGLMPGPSPRVTVNNPPPCSLRCSHMILGQAARSAAPPLPLTQGRPEARPHEGSWGAVPLPKPAGS